MARRPQTIQARVAPVQPAAKDTRAGTDLAPIKGDVKTPHPDLAAMTSDYAELRDVRDGSTTVKAAGEKYLPMPSGFRAQADNSLYNAYITRAQFPDIFSPAIQGMVGIIHNRDFQIEGLDGAMEGLVESASPDGMPLEILSRRITEEVMTVGRVALLVDANEDGDSELPYIALYRAEDLINWSEERDFFVLRESFRERDGFYWTDKTRYRVLTINEDEAYQQQLFFEGVAPKEGVKTDTKGEAAETSTEQTEEPVVPTARGGGAMEEIPLVVVGSRDLSLEPDEIPLIGVARSALAIYRLDADYRHQLFMSGQETLFITGLTPDDAPSYVGAGVVVCLPAEAFAEYVGPAGTGIAAHKTAIDDERNVAAAAGAQLLDSTQKSAESGDALRIRARASTATLISVALTSAAGLEAALRHAAKFVGADADKIVVTPNLDFVDSKLTPEEIKAQMELWMNKVISYETFYDNLQRGEIASQERNAEEEQLAVAEEDAAIEDDEAALDEEGDLTEGAGDDETGDVSDEELAEMFDPELIAGD